MEYKMIFVMCYIYAIAGGIVGLFVATLASIGVSGGTTTDFLMRNHLMIAITVLVILVATTLIYHQFFSQHQTTLAYLGVGTGIILAYPLWIVLVVYFLF